MGFVERMGSQLVLDGSPFRLAGANNYYFAFRDGDEQTRLLDLAESLSLNVLRIWAFNDFKPGALGALPGESDVCFQFMRPGGQWPELREGALGLERLDRAVKLAGERGIRLVLTLTNYWPDYGGMPQYQQWMGLQNLNDFYRDRRAITAFQSWVDALMMRVNPFTGLSYSDDPTILAWEIANEPRCGGKTGGTGLLTEWLDEMSEFIRVRAPRQLIAAGDEGFFDDRSAGKGWLNDGSEGVDSEAILALPEIDFGTFHLYPDVYAAKADPVAFGAEWIERHADCGVRAAKPVVLAEYGLAVSETGLPGARDQAYAAWLKEIEDSEGGGDLVWMIGFAGQGDRYLLTDPGDAPSIREHAMRYATPPTGR